MKKEYNKPELVEEEVELEDVIAASNGGTANTSIINRNPLSDLFPNNKQ